MRFEKLSRLRRKRPFLWGSLCAFGLFAALWAFFGLYVVYLQMTGNFHTVVSGELYRSAQPTRSRLLAYQQQYGIKTVLNLRGEHKGSKWYEDEVSVSQTTGMTHINYSLSAGKELTQDQVNDLVRIFERSPKPILIHCQHGSDRTGFASALYLASILKKGEEEAEGQISFFYGHVPIPYLSGAFAMDQTFEDIEAWLGYKGS